MTHARPQPWFRRLLSLVTGIALTAALIAADPLLLAQTPRSSPHWVGTWATAGMARAAQPPAIQGRGQGAQPPRPPLNFNNQTLRQIVHASIGGERVRVVLSNVLGTAPLQIGAAHIALRDKEAAIVAGSDRPLTFSGNPAMTIPAGAVIVSDAVGLAIPAFADLAIDIFLPGDTGAGTSPLTMHNGARQTNYVSSPGNHAGEGDLPVMTTTPSWFFLARVEVTAAEQVGAVVTLGDSITDGYNSTPNTNNRWPDHLARRLGQAAGTKMAVMNVGIDGNKVLADGNGVAALARFDRDVVAQTGATHLVVLEGINDLGLARDNPEPSAADIIAGYKQLIERAHARGLKIYAGTLMPFEGATFAGYWTAQKETTRGAVNEWIRTGKAFDGVFDFDAVVRDPSEPMKYLPKFDSGDHLHPNDAGYEAMANAIDRQVFKTAARGTPRSQ